MLDPETVRAIAHMGAGEVLHVLEMAVLRAPGLSVPITEILAFLRRERAALEARR